VPSRSINFMRHLIACLIASSAVAESIHGAPKNSPYRIHDGDAFLSAESSSGDGIRGSVNGSSDNGDDDAFDSDSYLANWMGAIAPALTNSTLLDMSLPGTHDTMTYDLTTVSTLSSFTRALLYDFRSLLISQRLIGLP
jgi:hypothetical protein